MLEQRRQRVRTEADHGSFDSYPFLNNSFRESAIIEFVTHPYTNVDSQ